MFFSIKSFLFCHQDSIFSVFLFWLQENVLRASKTLNAMNDGFFVRLVPSESMIIKTANLASSLKKVGPKDVNGLTMEEGPSKFQLPENLGEMGTDNVNAKVRDFLFL